MPRKFVSPLYQYFQVPASQTNMALGSGGGAQGDYLKNLVIVISTAVSSQVTLSDGAMSQVVMPANMAQGAYNLPIGAKSANGPWKVTTQAGVSLLAVGDFT